MSNEIELIRRAVEESGDHAYYCRASFRNVPCMPDGYTWIPDDCDCWLSEAKQYIDKVSTGG